MMGRRRDDIDQVNLLCSQHVLRAGVRMRSTKLRCRSVCLLLIHIAHRHQLNARHVLPAVQMELAEIASAHHGDAMNRARLLAHAGTP